MSGSRMDKKGHGNDDWRIFMANLRRKFAWNLMST